MWFPVIVSGLVWAVGMGLLAGLSYALSLLRELFGFPPLEREPSEVTLHDIVEGPFVQGRLSVPQAWTLITLVAVASFVWTWYRARRMSWTKDVDPSDLFAFGLVLVAFGLYVGVLLFTVPILVFGESSLLDAIPGIIRFSLGYWCVVALAWVARLIWVAQRVIRWAVRAEREEAAVQREMERLRAERSKPSPTEDTSSKQVED